MGPYLIHPDKLQAVHNILLKQKARKRTTKPQPQAATPGNNLVLKLLQQAYLQRRQQTGRSI